jgi:hypothetical protein
MKIGWIKSLAVRRVSVTIARIPGERRLRRGRRESISREGDLVIAVKTLNQSPNLAAAQAKEGRFGPPGTHLSVDKYKY